MHEWIFGKCLAKQWTQNKRNTARTEDVEEKRRCDARTKKRKKYGEMLLAHIWTHFGFWYVSGVPTMCRVCTEKKKEHQTRREKSHHSPSHTAPPSSIFLLFFASSSSCCVPFLVRADTKWNPWKIGHFEFCRKTMANGIGGVHTIIAMKAFSRRVWLNKLPPRRCMRIYHTGNGSHSANASVLSPWAHTRTIRYFLCPNYSRHASACRQWTRACVCVADGPCMPNDRDRECVDTKLKHLIFTHLLEKHLCEISIYNTHDGTDHREVARRAGQKQHFIYVRIWTRP